MDSRPGEGTRFRIYFPLVKEAKPAAVTTAKTGTPTLTPTHETVLLVEDEEEVRTMIQEVLGKRGYKVLEARDGGDALELCREHKGPIHLMVTDVVMPQLNGCDLARRLEPIRPEMRVLYMSGHGRETVKQRVVSGDRQEFLEKPFSPDALSNMIRKVLDDPRSVEI